MMAVLTHDELQQAVSEWFLKRNLVVPAERVEFYVHHQKGSQSANPTHPNYTFHARLTGIELPIKNGPYR